jgi:AsmA protein
VITGRLGGQIDLRADAGVPDVVFRTARGRATLAIRDGTVPALDLVGPVILAFGKPDASKAGRGSNAFSSLDGTFTLAGGVLRSDDLTMTSRDVDLRGHGTLRVAGAVVNLRADLVLSEALSSQAGRDLYRYAHEGSRVVLPATITGGLASPTVSIDIGAAAGRALRNAVDDELKKGLDRLIKH